MKFHAVSYTDAAIEFACRIRIATSRTAFCPTGIDLIDEAGAAREAAPDLAARGDHRSQKRIKFIVHAWIRRCQS